MTHSFPTRRSSDLRAKARLRRPGLESYGTIAADFWDGINDATAGSRPQDAYPVPADPAEARGSGSGNCIDACATQLASNPGARFPNAFRTSHFEQRRDRLTYSATRPWKPGSHLTLTAE